MLSFKEYSYCSNALTYVIKMSDWIKSIICDSIFCDILSQTRCPAASHWLTSYFMYLYSFYFKQNLLSMQSSKL